ncbi:MAG: DUF3408 domain-containing protein [Bacteroidota bacterium]|nr:DUF3408 domain-containing protein [Bacteroidota bacterium]
MSKKVDTSGLDSDFIIGQTDRNNRGVKPSPVETPTVADVVPEQVKPVESVAEPIPAVVEVPCEENKRRRKPQPEDYEALFIRTAPTTTRSGKAAYIRKEFHERIMRIVQNIGFNEVSLFSYIDNVLEHHFNTYQDDITELYRKLRPEDIF